MKRTSDSVPVLPGLPRTVRAMRVQIGVGAARADLVFDRVVSLSSRPMPPEAQELSLVAHAAAFGGFALAAVLRMVEEHGDAEFTDRVLGVVGHIAANGDDGWSKDIYADIQAKLADRDDLRTARGAEPARTARQAGAECDAAPARALAAALDRAVTAYATSGMSCPPDLFDEELAEVAGKAAGTLRQCHDAMLTGDRAPDMTQVAVTDLLAVIAAARAALGMEPTPTGPAVVEQWRADNAEVIEALKNQPLIEAERCLARRVERGDGDCSGQPDRAVVFRSSGGALVGGLIRYVPGCARHALAERDRVVAGGELAQVSVEPLRDVLLLTGEVP